MLVLYPNSELYLVNLSQIWQKEFWDMKFLQAWWKTLGEWRLETWVSVSSPPVQQGHLRMFVLPQLSVLVPTQKHGIFFSFKAFVNL